MEIPGYSIISEIGRGGMATVYLAVQKSLGRHVALKVMTPILLATDSSFGERFLREGRTVAQLRHPGIVQVYDIGAVENSYYMAMEYVPGEDLSRRIRRAMSEAEAVSVLEQMAGALAFAHSKGYVHRDIKPENILFDEHGRALLTDFGIARAMSDTTRITRAGMSIGTPHYMSPEQARGHAVDGRSDLYALGVIFYEMLTGRLPYDAEETFAVAYSHINDPVPRLPAEQALYQFIIEGLMAKSPDDRFQDAMALTDAIFQVTQGLYPEKTTQTAVQTSGGHSEYPHPGTAPKDKRDDFWEYGRGGEDDNGQGSDYGTRLTDQAAHTGAGTYPGKNSNAVAGAKWALGGAMVALLFAVLFLFVPSMQERPVIINGGGGGGSSISEPETSKEPPLRQNQVQNQVQNQRQNQEIEDLLVAAAADLEALRLTMPKDNNAFEKYRRVLDMDSRNAQAQRGLEQLVASYVALIDEEIGRNNLEDAETHLLNALQVLPDSPELDSAAERIRKAREIATVAEARKREVFERHMAAGRRAMKDRDRDSAIDAFKAALLVYPGERSARQGLVRAREIPTGPLAGDTFTDRHDMTFAYIPPGEFDMGSPANDPNRLEREAQYQVVLTRGYWIQIMPVTQNQWEAVMGHNPSHFSGCGDCPVERVSWHDIQEFLSKLNQSVTKGYRLPTETEWERAARAGTKTRFFFGDNGNRLREYAWFRDNSEGKTHPVGQKKPNAWGLYDMYGNVSEWCADWYGEYPRQSEAARDPKGPESGLTRVIRGGNYNSLTLGCRSAFRHWLLPSEKLSYVGLRLVLQEIPE